MSEVDDEILIGEGVRLEAGAAPVTYRMVSGLIDIVVSLVVIWGSSFLVSELAGTLNAAASKALIIVYVVTLLVLAPATVETLTRGRSVGRIAMGLRIVRDDGGPVSFRQAIIRAVVGLLEVWLTFGVGAVTVSVLSARGKRGGDMLAGTYALRTRGTLKPLPPVMLPPPLAEWARTADISRLPDGLALTARLFLGRAAAMHPASRARIGTRIALRLDQHVAPSPPAGTHPETYIAAVIATRRDREYATALRQASREMTQGELLRRLPHGVPDVEN
jgi:uncharacterized RDD family membrane protein YckC